MKTITIKCDEKTYEQFKALKKSLKMSHDGTLEVLLKVYEQTQEKEGKENDK